MLGVAVGSRTRKMSAADVCCSRWWITGRSISYSAGPAGGRFSCSLDSASLSDLPSPPVKGGGREARGQAPVCPAGAPLIPTEDVGC
jgi:hypothetical protein